MAINETISIGNKYRRLKDATNMIWQRLSFWTHASDVEFSDDSNLNDNMTANSNVFNFVYSNGLYGYMVNGTFRPFDVDSAETTVTLSGSNWSNDTTTVNGINYRYYIANFSKIFTEHPIVSLDSRNDTIPTSDEETAFSLITAAIANVSSNTITFYAEVAPSTDLYLTIKGAV